MSGTLSDEVRLSRDDLTLAFAKGSTSIAFSGQIMTSTPSNSAFLLSDK